MDCQIQGEYSAYHGLDFRLLVGLPEADQLHQFQGYDDNAKPQQFNAWSAGQKLPVYEEWAKGEKLRFWPWPRRQPLSKLELAWRVAEELKAYMVRTVSCAHRARVLHIIDDTYWPL